MTAKTDISTSRAASRFGWLFLALGLFLVAVIGIGGWIYFKQGRSEVRRAAQEMLSSIADLKASQIAGWLKERRGDTETALYKRQAKQLLVEPDNAAIREELLQWMSTVQRVYDYSAVTLFDASGVVRLAVPSDAPVRDAHYVEKAREALREREVVMLDLHRASSGHPIHLSFLVPVGIKPQAGQLADGVLLFEVDPQRFLYPLIQSWPTPSKTAETLLVRREGDEALFLNELRHRKGTAMVLRHPLNDPQLPAALGLRGETGIIEGVDYRGEPVVAVTRPVPGTSWVMVAKVDAAELYAPVRRHALAVGSVALVLLLAAALGVGFLWRQRDAHFFRRQMLVERERARLSKRLALVTEHANDIILMADEGRQILEANTRAVEAYGYTLEELRQKTLVELRTPAERARFAEHMEALRRQGHLLFETEHQRKDGRVFPVEVSARMVEIEGACYHFTLVRDITERKAHEAEIERLSRLYATLSQINQTIVRVKSREELCREVCNHAIEFGEFKLAWIGWHDAQTSVITPLACAGEPKDFAYTVIHTSDETTQHRCPCGPVVRSGQRCILNDLHTVPEMHAWQSTMEQDGLHSAAVLPIRFKGQVCGVFAVYAGEANVFHDKEIALLEEAVLDISFALDHLESEAERQRALDVLRESESRFRALIEDAPEGIFVQSDKRFLFLNPVMLRLLGAAKPEELLGTEFIKRIAPEYHDAVRERIRLQRETGQEAPPMDQEYLRLDGSRVSVETTAVAIRFEGRDAHLVFVRDITERKRAEAALREANEQLEKALADLKRAQSKMIEQARLKVIGQMASGIAHDFNNALSPILGFCELLLENAGMRRNDEKLCEFLQLMFTAGKDAANVVRRLRELYRKQTDRTELVLVNLSKVAQQAVKLTEPRWKEESAADGVMIRVELDLQAVPETAGNDSTLHEALTNLILNAVDAMPQGGTIRVRAYATGPTLFLEVGDTGIGMTEEVQQRCFDPFFSTKGERGTGLGLAMVKGTIHDHDGEIYVTSKPGKGTTFTIRIPIHAMPGKGSKAAQPERIRRNLRILLVDDEQMVRQVYVAYLQRDGHDVVIAENGPSGLAAFARRPFDLVVTDMAMPGMNGEQLAACIHELSPNAPVIMLTGFGDLMKAREQKPPGIAVVVSKPATLGELRAAVQDALQGASKGAS